MPHLLLIRGLPGSGKSTMARQCVDYGYRHIEADMFFICPATGEYNFNQDLLTDAHEWCFDRVLRDLLRGNDVVVSNTFTRRWEYVRYVEMAAVRRIPCSVITASGQHGNIHGVPVAVVQAMRKRWQD